MSDFFSFGAISWSYTNHLRTFRPRCDLPAVLNRAGSPLKNHNFGDYIPTRPKHPATVPSFGRRIQEAHRLSFRWNCLGKKWAFWCRWFFLRCVEHFIRSNSPKARLYESRWFRKWVWTQEYSLSCLINVSIFSLHLQCPHKFDESYTGIFRLILKCSSQYFPISGLSSLK